MKYYRCILFSSILVCLLSFVCSKFINVELSQRIIVQLESLSYLITFVGIIPVFAWYKSKTLAVGVGASSELKEKIERQSYNILFVICVINALLVTINSTQAALMMMLMALMVIAIAPVLFRTMIEKKNTPKDEDVSEFDNNGEPL